MGNNHHRVVDIENTNTSLWTIREIEAKLLPPEKGAKRWPLYREIILRLEQTSDKFALAIHIPVGGQSARAAIARMANERLGKGAITFSSSRNADGSHMLYARRGPKWSK